LPRPVYTKSRNPMADIRIISYRNPFKFQSMSFITSKIRYCTRKRGKILWRLMLVVQEYII